MSFGHFGEGLPGTNSLSHSGTPSPVRGGPALQLRLPGSGGQGHMTLVWPLRPAHERQAWLHRRHGEDCLGPWGAVGAVAAGAVAENLATTVFSGDTCPSLRSRLSRGRPSCFLPDNHGGLLLLAARGPEPRKVTSALGPRSPLVSGIYLLSH